MIEKLFTRKEVDRAELDRFEIRVGLSYGIVFGSALVLVGWGVDAWESWNIGLELYWAKLPFATITLVPICAVAGWLSGRFKRSSAKTLIWGLAGALTGLIAIHLPFDGTSAIASLIDPAIGNTAIFPFVQAAQDRTIGMTAFGATAGVLAGLVQRIAGGLAWEHSSADDRMTLGAWAALLVCAPVAIGLGSVYDGGANAPLRGPGRLTQRLIQLALDSPTNPDTSRMSTRQVLDHGLIARWRDRFSSRYTQRIAGFDAQSLEEVDIDTEFDTGFIWRCEITQSGSYVRRCFDLVETYRDWVTQFLRTSQIHCESCTLRVEPEAVAWQTRNARALANPTQLDVIHQSGGVVTVRAMTENRIVECQIVGAVPVNLRTCDFVK
jgi:hypothetical protein